MHASTIRIDTLPAVVAGAVLALLCVAAVPWAWDRWRRKVPGRMATTVLAVVAVVAACGLAVNAAGSFYPTLGSLLGTSPNPEEGTVADAGPDGRDLGRTLATAAQRSANGQGSLLHLTVTGARTHLTRDVDVYLPAGYTSPGYAGFRFPAIEWIPHFPGEPRQVATLYGLPDLLDKAIASHRLPPTVVIIADPNGEPRLTHDSECVDAVGGPANDTFLSADLRSWAYRTLRVRTDREGWAIAGWSSGGYCALNLTVRHPQWFAAAVSMSGYDATPRDVETGDLFHGRRDIQHANDVSATLREHPSAVRLLVTADGSAGDERAALERLRAAAAPPVELTTWTLAPAGHNLAAVREELPAVLDWLDTQLGNPVPAGRLPAGQVTAAGVWPLPDVGTPGSLRGEDATP
ncbi:alpha/beta hydrolase [Amycolatopsis alkalitolerans]|uniref:Esterase n=1 Tax=Amycolatopsis alkalitolerans TaxID=2547244 RepID=A0A5C4M1X0_9PSEU|nr:alpha/beta hydrolase-fold protein [Amycolatopsis alkalitolerans]TNC26888.1 esterase [Amycolatopsis alkalitolerans]